MIRSASGGWRSLVSRLVWRSRGARWLQRAIAMLQLGSCFLAATHHHLDSAAPLPRAGCRASHRPVLLAAPTAARTDSDGCPVCRLHGSATGTLALPAGTTAASAP